MIIADLVSKSEPIGQLLQATYIALPFLERRAMGPDAHLFGRVSAAARRSSTGRDSPLFARDLTSKIIAVGNVSRFKKASSPDGKSKGGEASKRFPNFYHGFLVTVLPYLGDRLPKH